ncbi:hypothetical protein GCM10017691_59500 [Pseudonocardia petroleophila]
MSGSAPDPPNRADPSASEANGRTTGVPPAGVARSTPKSHEPSARASPESRASRRDRRSSGAGSGSGERNARTGGGITRLPSDGHADAPDDSGIPDAGVSASDSDDSDPGDGDGAGDWAAKVSVSVSVSVSADADPVSSSAPCTGTADASAARW